MASFLNTVIFCIPLAFLLWGAIPSFWLNRRAAVSGRRAEQMAWFCFIVTVFTIGFFVISAHSSISGSPIFGARIDAISMTMLSLVGFLGAVILRFSRNYLAGDATQGYFFKWMAFTLGAVMLLTISPGLIQFFLAWVMTSLGLHKLLIYFPDRLGTLLSARKKFVVSRVGDLCLLIGFTGIFQVFGSQNFEVMFSLLEQVNIKTALGEASWIGWFIVFGAILKSAQFPFHTWLPDTMGAPTPVSALMHAGIINAGGFLIIRLAPVLVEIPSALHCLALVGLVTAIFAVVVMLTQTSVKRSLAYSTIAQMGFMCLQCGLGAFHLALLHIVAHSLYKGHTFLSSGSTVDSIKRLRSLKQTNNALPLPLLAGYIIGACALIIGLSIALDIQPQDKPGMLIFGVILSMAVAHLMIKRIQVTQGYKAFISTLIWGTGFAALYFALALGAQALLNTELPQAMPTAWALESTLAILLFTVLLISILIQNSSIAPVPARLRNIIYVHALNGFYLNTLANRISQKLGLTPSRH